MKTVISKLRKVEVDILDTDGEMITVRAKEGAPFVTRSSKPPYWEILSDLAYVRESDVLDEDLPLPEYDAAEHDSLFADWIDGEGIDYAEYHDQNFHARG